MSDGRAVVRDGVLMVPDLLVGIAATAIGGGIVRIDRDCPGVVRNRTAVVALGGVGRGAVQIDVRVAWLGRDRV
jgi:hypothetical protein